MLILSLAVVIHPVISHHPQDSDDFHLCISLIVVVPGGDDLVLSW